MKKVNYLVALKTTLVYVFIALSPTIFAQIKVGNYGNIAIGNTTPSSSSYQTHTIAGAVEFATTSSSYSSIIVDGHYEKVIHPSVTNYCTLGSASKAFRDIYTYNLYTLNSYSTQKENIRDLNNSLDIVMKLKSIKYDLKRSIAYDSRSIVNAKDFENKEAKRKDKIGFVGQDLIKILPTAVSIDDSTGVYAIDYTRIIPVLVNVIQEQLKKRS